MGQKQLDAEMPNKLCGRPFDTAGLERIRREIVGANPPRQTEIARRICRALDWTDALGRPKLMSAGVGLLELHRAALFELPPPSRGNGNGRGLIQGPGRSGPSPCPRRARSGSCADCAWQRYVGGFLNRKHGGFSGPKTLWIGLQRIQDFVLAREAQRSVGMSYGVID
jgi:hypothetical protein